MAQCNLGKNAPSRIAGAKEEDIEGARIVGHEVILHIKGEHGGVRSGSKSRWPEPAQDAERLRFGRGAIGSAMGRCFGAHLASQTALDLQQFSVR